MDTSRAPDRSAAAETPASALPAAARRAEPPTAGRAGKPPQPVDPAAPARVRAAATARRRFTLVGLGVLAATAATALFTGLLTWAPDPAEPPRSLTVAESERLAAARVTNYRDGRAGVRAAVGTGGDRTELVGWVDWARPLVYLDVGGPGAGSYRGLVQALPGLVAVRPDPVDVPTPAAPPVTPPADGWRIRSRPDATPLASFLDLLFGLAADRPDAADAVRAGGARWIGRSTAGPLPVDVLRAPTAPRPAPNGTRRPSTGSGSATPDGGTRYWVDRDARLHRLTTRLPGGIPVAIELDRTDRPALRRVDLLGGRPTLPRALTDADRARLARMPARNRARGGATLTLAVPTGTGGNLRGGGWIDWQRQVAYLSTGDLDDPGRRTLVRRDGRGVLRADVPAGAGGPSARPPLPPPAGPRWRPGPPGTGELDLLVDAALAVGRQPVTTAGASWLRRDSVGGREVEVVQCRTVHGRLRYWTERTGLLVRLELVTHAGAYAQLDLTPGRTPPLPPVSRAPARTPPR